jgi:hypothetical protein
MFESANSSLSLTPSPLNVRGMECILGLKTSELIVFFIFTQKCHEILTFLHAIISDIAKNTHQSTGKEGEIKPT